MKGKNVKKDEAPKVPRSGSLGLQRQNVKEIIRHLAFERGSITSGEAARVLGISRQAAHYHLRRLAESGELIAVGAGRGARYDRPAPFVRRYPVSGLMEHEVWRDVVSSIPDLQQAPDNTRSIVQYAFTEMLNNAIDHSGSPDAQVSVWTRNGFVGFEIADEGIGVFRRVREARHLEDDFAALQEISKGKVTTDPARHTGEGIFFTSKVVDLFTLESGGLRWTVDNLRGDQAVGEAPHRPGTRVRCEVATNTSRTLRDVFDAYTDAGTHAFRKSRTIVRLFESGERFVSRSEAKRLARSLERFGEVFIDFQGVTEVGQGFVDELFRVWSDQHPETTLVPVNMAPAVEAMVRRGLPPSPGRERH